MKWRASITLQCGLLLTALLGCIASDASERRSTALTLGLETLKDSQAFALINDLTSTIGPRLSGSEQGAAAEQWVFDKLRAFGIRDVRFEAFPLVCWSRGSIELTVAGRSIPAAAMVYTPEHADVTSEIVDVGNGVSADYSSDYDKVRSKIALIYLGVLADSPKGTPYLPRWEKLALAIGHGARGVIFVYQAAGNHRVTGIAGGSAKVVTIPVAVISHEDGFALRRDLAAGARITATFRMDNRVRDGHARNVIATIPGTERPDEVIVLGGHLDSLDLATGAVDNGSGAMWVLDVARAFSVHHVHPKSTVQFVFFMGEEEGLLGSYSHVRRALRDHSLQGVRFMINTDMAVNPKGLRVWGGDPNLKFFEAFAKDVQKIYPSFNDIGIDQADMSQSSDSQPYIEQGVPIVYPLAAWPDGLMACVHAECDDIHWLDDAQMRRSAVIGGMLLLELANAPDAAAHVMTPSETAEYFKKADITRAYLGPVEAD